MTKYRAKPTEVDGIVFTVLMPPSSNHLFAHTPDGRFKTKAYKTWQMVAGCHLKDQRVEPITERCEIEIVLPNSGDGDADNRIKPTLDLIVLVGIIKDDAKRYVRKVSAEWGDHDGDKAIVKVRAA